MDTIRVWLEPEYDHGRTGAWLLDWPGAFTWAATRAGALARATGAAHRFVEWLADHDDHDVAPVGAVAEVIEEVPAYRRDDGYEVNATFSADRRAATSDELEATLRRIGFAREDLLRLDSDVASFLAKGGELPTESREQAAVADGAADGRDFEGVLRHVAGAESWFVSRLDPSARYEGARDDLDDYLAGTREFLVANLRRLQRADPQLARVEGKGEEWTVPKVLRRALYHSLDHLGELDRRLAEAEHRLDRLELRINAPVDPATLRRLFGRAGMTRRANDSEEKTQRMLHGSTETVSAWEGDELVGFGRIVSDEATNGYLSAIVIAPRWQDRGLGTRIMRSLMHGRDSLKLTLDAREGAESFYERLGFGRIQSAFVRPRQEGDGR